MISNFQGIRRDGKVIPEGMTGMEMIAAGWEPDKVLRLRWDRDGHPIELASSFGFLWRIVASREYLVVMEDVDEMGQNTRLSLYLPDGTLQRSFPDIVAFPATATLPARTEEGEYVWFHAPTSPLPNAFAVVFRVYRSGGTFAVEMDAVTGTVLSIHEVR